MKYLWISLLVIVLGLAINAGVRFFLAKRQAKRAEAGGIVVYATLVSSEKMTGLMKYAEMYKVVLRLQDPGTTTPREVTLKTRLPPGQKMTPGLKIPVVIDPDKKDRVFPASPEAAKRAQITGSRLERRHMRVGNQRGNQQPPRDNIPYPRNLNRR